MLNILILHMLNKKAKDFFLQQLWHQNLTHSFTTVDWTAPYMDDKLKLPIAAAMETQPNGKNWQ